MLLESETKIFSEKIAFETHHLRSHPHTNKLSTRKFDNMSETAAHVQIGTTKVKKGLAQMLKGGVIVSIHRSFSIVTVNVILQKLMHLMLECRWMS